jgi:hypothetical protein
VAGSNPPITAILCTWPLPRRFTEGPAEAGKQLEGNGHGPMQDQDAAQNVLGL